MKTAGCEIEARGVTYSIANPTAPARASLHVLKSVSCRARPYEILAVVGPSGAGKSTLLEVLAGKLTPADGSAVLVGGQPVSRSQFKKLCGYVQQRDVLFPLLTVRETLVFSAKLRGQDTARVEALMAELGLGHVAGVRVGAGDGKVRGISGGERRRVSIGVEVVHDPRVLILDEPTSGLDSASALQIVEMLKVMAEAMGRTVVMSIHQPGFRIVKLFGSVLLMAEGAVVHQGSVDQLQMRLRTAGLEVPAQVNVVEFAIDAIETLQQEEREEDRRLQWCLTTEQRASRRREGKRCTLQQLFQLNKVVDEESVINFPQVINGSTNLCCHDYANSRPTETAILAHRFLKIVYRTRELFACRTIQMLVSGLVLGSIFFDLDDNAAGARDRVALFAFILTFLLSSTTEALPIFLQERDILTKETSAGAYRVSSYAVANALVFLPFLLVLALLFSAPLYWLAGLRPCLDSFAFFVLLVWLILYTANSAVVCISAMAPDFIVGSSVISGVMGSFFLFSGYFISKEAMPGYWVFMHYASLFKYPFEALVVNEFGGKCLEYELGVCLVDGDRLLREEGLGGEGRKWRDVVVMLGFILGFRVLAYVVLRVRCVLDQRGGVKRAAS